MKISVVFLVVCSGGRTPERKYSDKEEFMNSAKPSWWEDHSAEARFSWLQTSNEVFFSKYFSGLKAFDKLKPLYVDLIQDAKRISSECTQGSRKRRNTEEGDDLLDNIVVDDIIQDIENLPLSIARWIKYEVHDLGGECEFLGERMVSLSILFSLYILRFALVSTNRSTSILPSLCIL